MFNTDDGLGALMGALAETSLELDDEVLLIEARDQGLGPEAAADAVLGLLRRAGKHHRQRLLRAAHLEYERAKEALQTRWVELPDAPEDRRLLLSGIFARNPAVQAAYLTVQHREFKELTDGDVESCLAQMAELGLFEETDDEPEDVQRSRDDDGDEDP